MPDTSIATGFAPGSAPASPSCLGAAKSTPLSVRRQVAAAKLRAMLDAWPTEGKRGGLADALLGGVEEGGRLNLARTALEDELRADLVDCLATMSDEEWALAADWFEACGVTQVSLPAMEGPQAAKILARLKSLDKLTSVEFAESQALRQQLRAEADARNARGERLALWVGGRPIELSFDELHPLYDTIVGYLPRDDVARLAFPRPRAAREALVPRELSDLVGPLARCADDVTGKPCRFGADLDHSIPGTLLWARSVPAPVLTLHSTRCPLGMPGVDPDSLVEFADGGFRCEVSATTRQLRVWLADGRPARDDLVPIESPRDWVGSLVLRHVPLARTTVPLFLKEVEGGTATCLNCDGTEVRWQLGSLRAAPSLRADTPTSDWRSLNRGDRVRVQGRPVLFWERADGQMVVWSRHEVHAWAGRLLRRHPISEADLGGGTLLEGKAASAHAWKPYDKLVNQTGYLYGFALPKAAGKEVGRADGKALPASGSRAARPTHAEGPRLQEGPPASHAPDEPRVPAMAASAGESGVLPGAALSGGTAGLSLRGSVGSATGLARAASAPGVPLARRLAPALQALDLPDGIGGDGSMATVATATAAPKPMRDTKAPATKQLKLTPEDLAALQQAEVGDTLRLGHTFPEDPPEITVTGHSTAEGREWAHVCVSGRPSEALRELTGSVRPPPPDAEGRYHYTIPITDTA